MPSIKNRKRGFFTFAQNSNRVDYVRLAYGLALSILHTQKSAPYLTIGITPGTSIDPRYEWAFDNIVEIPWGDDAASSDWKLENEWKAAWMTPYEETMKLDCDMLLFGDLAPWWENLAAVGPDFKWATRVLNWRGSTVDSDYYRKTFTASRLPNIYTGMGWFRKSDQSFSFFETAKLITWNWQRHYDEFLSFDHRPDRPSTDVTFALATKIHDVDGYHYGRSMVPTFTHMKSRVQGWKNQNIRDDWREHISPFFSSAGECRIGNHLQVYPLHYHLKDFLCDSMILKYERLVGHVR